MRTRGFTLLEMLIVLAMMAAIAALVTPQLQRTYDAVARSGERADVARQLERLPVLARTNATPLVFARGDATGLARLVRLPQGWVLTPETPLRIEASGLCGDGRVRVEHSGRAEVWTITSPACEVDDAP